MLALFKSILSSKKLSGPRLQLSLSKPPRILEYCFQSNVAQRKRPRNPEKSKQKEELAESGESPASLGNFLNVCIR